jgi:hypothetical protein
MTDAEYSAALYAAFGRPNGTEADIIHDAWAWFKW